MLSQVRGRNKGIIFKNYNNYANMFVASVGISISPIIQTCIRVAIRLNYGIGCFNGFPYGKYQRLHILMIFKNMV